MVNFVKFRWGSFREVRLHRIGKGVFIFQMSTEEGKQSVLEGGPWSFSRRPLVVRSWSIGIPLDKPDLDHFPIWFQFSNLPLNLWTGEALSRLASHIGETLYADMNTSEQSRMDYARVCVEVSLTSVLYDEIPVKYAVGNKYFQKVDYKWVPKICSSCMTFGHVNDACPKKVVQENASVAVEVQEPEQLDFTAKKVMEANQEVTVEKGAEVNQEVVCEKIDGSNQEECISSGGTSREKSTQSIILIGNVNVDATVVSGDQNFGKNIPKQPATPIPSNRFASL